MIEGWDITWDIRQALTEGWLSCVFFILYTETMTEGSTKGVSQQNTEGKEGSCYEVQNQSSGRKHWEGCEHVEQELESCICYFSIAVKNTKATCNRKCLFGAYSSGGREAHHHHEGSLAAGRHTGSQAGRYETRAAAESSHLDPHIRSKRSHYEWNKSFEISEPTPTDTLPPISPHLLILLKQFCQLGTEFSNIWVFGSQSHSNNHKSQCPQRVTQTDL